MGADARVRVAVQLFALVRRALIARAHSLAHSLSRSLLARALFRSLFRSISRVDSRGSSVGFCARFLSLAPRALVLFSALFSSSASPPCVRPRRPSHHAVSPCSPCLCRKILLASIRMGPSTQLLPAQTLRCWAVVDRHHAGRVRVELKNAEGELAGPVKSRTLIAHGPSPCRARCAHRADPHAGRGTRTQALISC